MLLETLHRLLSPDGQAALAAATELQPTETKYPACFDRLRKHWPGELARAALDMVLLRERALVKFPDADRLYFDREALEMASGPSVAAYRARQFAGLGVVADLGCGIGSDAIELARAGCEVIAIERDPVRLRMAEANFTALGLSGRFVLADLLSDDLPQFDAAFADPGRRPGGTRVLSIHDYEPPLEALLQRLRTRPLRRLGMKVAPGVPAAEWQSFAGRVEFISSDRELKEAIFWSKPEDETGVQATVLPGPHILRDDAATPMDEVVPPRGYLYDPDPAVSRSGLVTVLGALLEARLMDPGIGFLTSEQPISTPFASLYRIEEVLPWHLKRVGEWLKTRGVGRVTIVKRGTSIDADEVMAKWKLRGGEHRSVILTRASGSAVAIVAERIEAGMRE